MQSGIKSMSLGDILENLFKLAGKTVIRNLIVIVILILPASLIFMYGIDTFFNSLVNLAEHNDEYGGMTNEAIVSMISTFFIYGVSIFIFVIGILLATLGVTIIGAKEFAGENVTWQEGFRQTFSIKFWKMLGASIIEGLAFFGIFFIPMIIFVILVSTKAGIAIFFGIVILIAAIIAVIFVAVRWSFVIPAIAYEDSGVIDSLRRSWNIVNGFWWRTFGILILLNIIVSFAVSIITIPLSFAVMLDVFAEMFKSFDFKSNAEPDPLATIKLFSSMGLRTGILSAVSSILSLLITPLISVVMYFDLRAKKNEFADDETPEEPNEPDNSVDLF
jgi:hypothetical protein